MRLGNIQQPAHISLSKIKKLLSKVAFSRDGQKLAHEIRFIMPSMNISQTSMKFVVAHAVCEWLHFQTNYLSTIKLKLFTTLQGYRVDGIL